MTTLLRSKFGDFNPQEGRRQGVCVGMYIAKCSVHYLRGRLCCLSLWVGSQNLERRVSLHDACAFFMDFNENEYSGPIELLDRDLVAFFASRTVTEQGRALALRWAEEISKTEKVVISGFHSPLEREVLEILLENRAHVIVGLGRKLYSKIPSRFARAYEEGRILFLSFRDYSRHSESNAQIRNWGIAKLANTLIFAPFEPGSSLSVMHFTFSTYNTQQKTVKILVA